MPGFTSVVVKTGSFTSVVVVVVVTVSVTLPSELVVVDDVDFVSTVVPVDSIFAEVFPSAAIGADVVVPFGATVVAVEVPVDSVEVAPVEAPVDSVVVVPVVSVEAAPVEVPVDSVVVVPVDSVEEVPVADVPVVSVEVVPADPVEVVLVDSVVVAPSLEDALVEAPLSVAEAVVPSMEDDAAPEALDSLEVPSDEEAPLPDSVATPVFSFVPSACAVIGDAMTAALKVAAAIPISFE